VKWFKHYKSNNNNYYLVTMPPSGTVMEIWRLKDNGVTTLTFWGYVTSSVTWPFDSQWSISYEWFIATMRLSCTLHRYGVGVSKIGTQTYTWHNDGHTDGQNDRSHNLLQCSLRSIGEDNNRDRQTDSRFRSDDHRQLCNVQVTLSCNDRAPTFHPDVD